MSKIEEMTHNETPYIGWTERLGGQLPIIFIF